MKLLQYVGNPKFISMKDYNPLFSNEDTIKEGEFKQAYCALNPQNKVTLDNAMEILWDFITEAYNKGYVEID